MRTLKTELQKIGIIFLFGFFIYVGLEVIWRTATNWGGTVPPRGLLAMGILGGIVTILLGYINEIKPLRRLPFWVHCIIGAVIVTGLEWITGRIINVGLGWNFWDYKHLILSTPDGQINLFFSLIWLGLSPVCFWLDDNIRIGYNIIVDGVEKNVIQVVENFKHSVRCVKLIRDADRVKYEMIKKHSKQDK